MIQKGIGNKEYNMLKAKKIIFIFVIVLMILFGKEGLATPISELTVHDYYELYKADLQNRSTADQQIKRLGCIAYLRGMLDFLGLIVTSEEHDCINKRGLDVLIDKTMEQYKDGEIDGNEPMSVTILKEVVKCGVNGKNIPKIMELMKIIRKKC